MLNCFRRLDFKSLRDIDVLSLKEYVLRMHAYNLAEVDRMQEMHYQAWLNFQVTAKEEVGNKIYPVYKSFKDFFDYEAEIKSLTEGKEKTVISDRMKKAIQIAVHINAGKEE